MQRMELLLRTRGRCRFDAVHVLRVFCEQRKRFVRVLDAFTLDDWAGATRCAHWSAHEVIRHLCDATELLARNDAPAHDLHAGFDPRVTPGEWLRATAGESPEATRIRFITSTEKLRIVVHQRLAEGARFDVHLPYGPMDWTVLLLHVFWDSWLHERDVLLARGMSHPTDDAAIGYVAAYGIFLAAAVASMLGDPLTARLALGGNGGRVFDLASCDGVALVVDGEYRDGPDAALVVDALAGRSTSTLRTLPADVVGPLSHVASFFNSPSGRGPAHRPPPRREDRSHPERLRTSPPG